jgi:ribosomal protein S18 acetylase RimI-like enzyme
VPSHQRFRHGEREVGDDDVHLAQVDREHVAEHDLDVRVFHPDALEERRKAPVDLDREHTTGRRRNGLCDRAGTCTCIEHDVSRREPGAGDEGLEDLRVAEKVLVEPGRVEDDSGRPEPELELGARLPFHASIMTARRTVGDHVAVTEIEIREVRLPEDAPALRELDTSFTTDVVYDVVLADEAFRLVPTRVTPPIRKRFSVDDLEDRVRAWKSGYVAIHGGRVCGFLATGYEPWNSRLVIWHFYVDPDYRRRGLGRRLLDRALQEAATRAAGAIWLETTSLNYPGVQAYLRLGFELCGLDTTLYRGTRNDGETALFLARSLE